MLANSPFLTVIIPVYDEAATIVQTLDAVQASGFSKQIIVVDDGSTDACLELVDTWSRTTGHGASLLMLRHARNRGRGAAIRTALEHASGWIVIVQDADLECDPADYPALVAPIVDGSAEVVFGSRFIGEGSRHPWTESRAFACVAGLLMLLLFGRRISDEAVPSKL